jgi:GNAT superfamily N-acetyltransferase
MNEEMKAQTLPEGANGQLIGQVIGQIGGFKERHCDPEREYCECLSFPHLGGLGWGRGVMSERGESRGWWQACTEGGDETRNHEPPNTTQTNLSPDMSILAVDPSQHRRGIGGMLLDAGLAEVDKAGGTTVIVASTMGLGLYLKHGFEPLDELPIDLDAAGIGHGVVHMKCLRRKGRGRKVAV